MEVRGLLTSAKSQQQVQNPAEEGVLLDVGFYVKLDSCYSVLSVHKDAFGQSLLSFGDVLWSVPFRSGLSRIGV